MSANVVTDLLGDLGDAAASVDHDVPLRKAPGERPVRLRDARPELRLGTLDAVALVADPGERGVDVDLHEEGEVWQEDVDGGQVQREPLLRPELAAGALIGDRRVDIAVADDRRAAGERRPDQLLDLPRACGGAAGTPPPP